MAPASPTRYSLATARRRRVGRVLTRIVLRRPRRSRRQLKFPVVLFQGNLGALVAAFPAGAAQAGQDSVVLVGPERTIVLRESDLRNMERDTATVSFHEGDAEHFSGVPLHIVLRAVGVHADSLRGSALRTRVILEAVDGYAIVLSLAEADPNLPDQRVLLADEVGGPAARSGGAVPADHRRRRAAHVGLARSPRSGSSPTTEAPGRPV